MNNDHWQVDKKIPVALIVAIIVQSAGLAFWIGQLSSRVDSMENQAVRYIANGDRLTRLEVQIDTLIQEVRRNQ